MNKGLKIIKIKVDNKDRNLFNVKFINENDSFDNQIFSTVLIGTNGSGKSYLMTLIIEILRTIEDELEGQKSTKSNRNRREGTLKYEFYNLVYSLNNNIYDITIHDKKITLKINGKDSVLENIVLPNKVLAVSFMVNDKFVFQPEEATKNIYSYLGVRESSNLTFTSSIQKNICNMIITSLEKKTVLKSDMLPNR